MKSFDSDDLSAKLRIWKVAPPVPAGFQREVWQRIATRQTAREEAFWPSLWRWLLQQLVRPQYAFAVILVSLSAGVGFAHVQAQSANAKQWKALELRYASSVDPLSMSR
jgi:hypothetical protein